MLPFTPTKDNKSDSATEKICIFAPLIAQGMKFKLIVCAVLLLLMQVNTTAVAAAEAQTHTEAGSFGLRFASGYRRFDNAIRRFLISGMDTTYVRLPATSWEIPLTGKVYGYLTNLTVGGEPLSLKPTPTFEAGAGIGYHGLDIVITKALKNAIDFNFEFDFYDNYWGLGINIGRESFGPEMYGEQAAAGKTELKCRSILLEGYFAFCGNKFSYPAAIYANYIQTKSAGSPLVTFWFEHRDYEPLSSRAMELFEANGRPVINEGAVLAGYGYNFSIAGGKAVINLSACAGVPLPYFGIATTGRIACMWWLNEHLRLFLNGVNFYQKSWSDKNMRMEDNTWRGSFGLTYCFGKNDR